MPAMDAAWLVPALLLSVRLGALALVAPPFGAATIPPSIRVAFVLALAVMLSGITVTGHGAPAASLRTEPAALLGAAASEAAIGAIMALGLAMAFAAFSIGARLIDVQVGFGLGQVFDPTTRQQSPVLSAAFAQLALVCFFLLDGHHALLRGIALSVESIPLGSAWDVGLALPAATRLAAKMFSLGLTMVAPVVLCLMVAELGLGVLSRSLPQMNTLVVGAPFKIVVGLAALALWAATGGSMMNGVYMSAFGMWEAMWR